MAGEGSKPTKEEGVLASLSSTRPSRLSRHARSSQPAKPKPKAAQRPKATATKARPAPPAKPAPVAPDEDATQIAPRPKPVRAAAPKLNEPIAKASEQRGPATARESKTSGTELVSTVVQAAGELAQIALTVSGQLLRRAVERLPRR